MVDNSKEAEKPDASSQTKEVDISEVERLVRSVARAPVDVENLVGNICLDCVQKGIRPTRKHVMHRLIDALRKRHGEVRLEDKMLDELSLRSFCQEQKREECRSDLAIDLTYLTEGLTIDEIEVVYKRFYKGAGVKRIAEETEVDHSIVSRRLQSALEKIRQKFMDLED